MKLRALSFALLACVGLSLHRSAAAQGIPCRYEIAHIIQAPPCGDIAQPTFGLAISPNGRWVVGYHCACVCISDRAFVFDTTTGIFTTLPLPADMSTSIANDVNDAGLVVGYVGGTGIEQGFVYDANVGQYLHFLPPAVPGGVCKITGINSANTVCGIRGIGGPPGYPTSAFIWSAKDGFSDLGVIDGRSTNGRAVNATGLVSVSTGFSSTLGSVAYLWSGGAPQSLGPAPGCLTSDIGVINDLGWASIGGMVQLNPPEFRSFLRWDDGAYLQRHPLQGGFSAGTSGITNSGLTSGHTNFGFPVQYRRATIWRNGQPIDLNTLVAPPVVGVLEDRTCISENEVIVVTGVNDRAENVGFVLLPILGASGDTDCNDVIDINDLLNVIGQWGLCAGCNQDLTRDGDVDIFDLVEVIVNWGATGGAR